jgi:hypothetical protein
MSVYITVRLLLSLRNNFAFFFLFLVLTVVVVVAVRIERQKVHKEKLLPSIAVMYVEVIVDTPRYCDYVCV